MKVATRAPVRWLSILSKSVAATRTHHSPAGGAGSDQRIATWLLSCLTTGQNPYPPIHCYRGWEALGGGRRRLSEHCVPLLAFLHSHYGGNGWTSLKADTCICESVSAERNLWMILRIWGAITATSCRRLVLSAAHFPRVRRK